MDFELEISRAIQALKVRIYKVKSESSVMGDDRNESEILGAFWKTLKIKR